MKGNELLETFSFSFSLSIIRNIRNSLIFKYDTENTVKLSSQHWNYYTESNYIDWVYIYAKARHVSCIYLYSNRVSLSRCFDSVSFVLDGDATQRSSSVEKRHRHDPHPRKTRLFLFPLLNIFFLIAYSLF